MQCATDLCRKYYKTQREPERFRDMERYWRYLEDIPEMFSVCYRLFVDACFAKVAFDLG